MRTELFMYFCIKKYIGTQGEVCRQLKIFLPPPHPPPPGSLCLNGDPDVVLIRCVALWFILRGASCFKVFTCYLSSCFVIPFSIA